jgi:outer membrane protein OmpA-like peptidoglycan-associated protein
MDVQRKANAFVLICATALLASCGTAPPAPVLRPAAFTPLGLNAPYLSGDLIGGHRARSAKMHSAKIHALSASAAPSYMAMLDRALRTQTAGIGLDVLEVGQGIIIRIPAALTFDEGSAGVKPEFDATLLEIAREVKSHNQTYVDVFAHSDLSGSPAANQAISDRRAAAVASYLSGHGVAKARIASKGLGESSPLYNPETSDADRAANRRVEIRLLPYTG